MQKTEKILWLKSLHGKAVKVVREHYVREDILCYSPLCLADCHLHQDAKLALLPKEATHYLVPDCQVAKDYLELLDFPELQGVLVLQTVLNAVQRQGRRSFRNLQNFVKDPRKRSVVFCNEFHKYCYCPRKPGETTDTWQIRNIYEGAEWFYNHLAGQMSIIILTNDRQVVDRFSGQTLGVYVMMIEDYLLKFWPDMTNIHLMYESLVSSLQESSSRGQDYKGYMPAELLQNGLQLGRYIQGVIQVSRHSAQTDAYVRQSGVSGKDTGSHGNQKDIYISGLAGRNRAVHGDVVVVELLPRTEWKLKSNAIKDNSEGATEEEKSVSGEAQPTGKVVGVTQRNWRDYVVTLEQAEEGRSNTKKSGRLLTLPMDWRIPKIRISTSKAAQLQDKRFLVRIDSWDVDSQYPNGHFVQTLGPLGDLETELRATLTEHQLTAAPFSEAQLKELPTNSWDNPWEMSAEEIGRRRDIRQSHLVFSIDPRGCEDVDDTLSVRELTGGNTELGVHIADVAYFVPLGSLTDLEGRSRSTTIYLADRRFDMLPAVLSADLCSLVSGVDRFAVSVIWELDKNFEVVSVWYGRTVIRSAYKLHYEFAQELSESESLAAMSLQLPELCDAPEADRLARIRELKKSVCQLMKISRCLKSKRLKGGALELESTEVAVQMAESKEITDLIPKQSLEIHDTIAECMIFANHWVGKKICESFSNQALLRHHPLPQQDHFAELLLCAAARGFTINTSSNKALAESLDRCEVSGDPVINKVLRTLATQAMSNAAYFSTGSLPKHHFFHYGLALDYYTHFTSPIRRYADLIVHRLLLAALGVEKKDSLFSNKDLQELCDYMNKKHRAAQNAQRASVELFQTLFFKDKSGVDEACLVDAVVLQLRSNGLLVYVHRYGIKTTLYLRNRDGLVAWVGGSGRAEWVAGSVTMTTDGATVTTATSSQKYSLLQHITVRIVVQESKAHAASLRLELVTDSCHKDAGQIVDSRKQKADIVKEVTIADRKDSESEAVHLGPMFDEWKQIYGQTPPENSFYNIMQTFHDLAMLDV